MHVIAIISTKGGVGKTTIAANLGGFIADAGRRVLLIDLDVQPTLSSYYTLTQRAAGGIYELLAFNEQSLPQLVSQTSVPNLDAVLSNDQHQQLGTLLLHAADGRDFVVAPHAAIDGLIVGLECARLEQTAQNRI